MLTLTADEEYSLRNRQTFWQPIQLQLSKKQIFFSQFLAACLKFASNVERFQRKMTVKGYVFLKLETAKMWLVKGLKNLLLEHLATVNMLSSQKTCTTALPSYCFITLAENEFENIGLSVSEIIRVFVNRLTADEPILFVLGRIYRNQFNCSYVRNKKKFQIFCCISEI